MSSTDQDPLLLLRQCIKAKVAVFPTASDQPDAPEVPLSEADYLTFFTPSPISIPIGTLTRFAPNNVPVDLRSVYFAWIHRESLIPEYNASASQLDEALGNKGQVRKFAFVERLELLPWLDGTSEESEHIKPLAAAPSTDSKLGRSGKGTLDPRMAVIYNSERKMGDHNSILRGIKPTDFSHVRKLAAVWLKQDASSSTAPTTQQLATRQKTRRPDPIILLSPSASSLLRMTNIKSFLEGSLFIPSDSPAATSSTGASMLHVNRLMKDIDPNRPIRFILVEGPEQFKPEYWSRVVAVFTTGQSWQFKQYKWSNPTELFLHVLGIYVGWRGEPPPESVRSWGHRVLNVGIDRFKDSAHANLEASRWRDREIVESIWKSIESSMRNKGWRKDQAPTSI